MRHRTRSDANSADIDQALRAVGASVLPLGDVGQGCPDRLIAFRGVTLLLEYKNPKQLKKCSLEQRKNLMRTPAQVEFHRTWQGKIVTVFSVDEALRAIGAIK